MKRKIHIIALTMALAATALCSCSQNSSDDTQSVKKTSETQEAAAAVTAAAEPAERLRLIYSDFNQEGMMPDITFSDDLDGDGVQESVTLTMLSSEWDYEYYVNIKVSSQTVNTSVSTESAFAVLAVYSVDLDTSDKAKEIGVMLLGEDDCGGLELFRFDNGILTPMTYEYTDNYNATYYTKRIPAAYEVSNPFTVNDDGTFTLPSQTTSYGMWNISVDYKVNESGYIVEIPQDYYDVVDIELCFVTDADGYASVEKTLTGRGFDLYAGDRITVLRDDGNNNLLLKKSSGETGWFKIRDDDYSLYETSKLFTLAG